MADVAESGAGTSGTVAFLGAGMMGEALIAGLLGSGRPAASIAVAERRAERAAQIGEQYGVRTGTPAQVVAGASAVVVVVKPGDVPSVLGEVAGALPPGALVISVAAGVTLARLEELLPAGTPVARVMPNTPALVSVGMSAVSPGTSCTPAHLETVAALLSPVGDVEQVPESQQDAVTAVSGSGPAYLFYVAEAMIEAGVHLGLPREVSKRLTVQTILGAATMLKETDEHPAVLRENVSSPGGTTVAALRVLEDYKVRAAFLNALEAARNRSAGL